MTVSMVTKGPEGWGVIWGSDKYEDIVFRKYKFYTSPLFLTQFLSFFKYLLSLSNLCSAAEKPQTSHFPPLQIGDHQALMFIAD